MTLMTQMTHLAVYLAGVALNPSCGLLSASYRIWQIEYVYNAFEEYKDFIPSANDSSIILSCLLADMRYVNSMT